MTADVATSKSKDLAGLPAGDASHEDQAASDTTTSDAAASPQEGTEGKEGAPTPFYDHLMSMIQETALENGRGTQAEHLVVVPPVAHHGWRMPYLMPFAAGLIVAVAAGGALIASKIGRREPPVVAAESAPEAGPQVVSSATTADEPAPSDLAAAEPDGREAVGAEVQTTAEGGSGADSVSPVSSDGPPTATPVPGELSKELGSAMEPTGGGPADGRAATTAAATDPIPPAADPAPEQPRPTDAPWSLEVAPARETGPTVDQANPPAAAQIARVVSAVNMRAGPSNDQAVLATIPRHSPVEVIACRSWCEVTFAGQRGWVYKTFIDRSANPGAEP
jgi:Bacterial SH3 domain